MKNVALILVSLLIAWVVWNVIKGLLFSVIGVAFQLLLLALFCGVVYMIYKALNREKIM